MAPTLQGLIECFVTQLVGPLFHCPAGDAKYRREGPVDVALINSIDDIGCLLYTSPSPRDRG